MNGALAEILWLGFRGGLVRRLRRLRQPRYLLAMLASIAYFVFVALPNLRSWNAWAPAARGGAGGGAGIGAVAGGATPLIAVVAALGGALVVSLQWLLTSVKPSLSLSEADLHLLLPAPLPRRKLIEYALWKQQVGLLFGAAVVWLLRSHGPPGARLFRFYMTWGLITLATLHVQGIGLWKARLRELPRRTVALRMGLAVLVLVGYWAAIGLALARVVTPLLGTAGGGGLGAQIGRLLAGERGRPLRVLLAPFLWLSGPLATAWGRVGRGAFGSGLAGAGAESSAAWAALWLAALLVLHYEWVVRSRGRFEEAALERARRALERRTRRPAARGATARARRQEPFALAPHGMPEGAIWWKNLLLAGRAPIGRSAWLIAAVAAGVFAAGIALPSPLAHLGNLGLPDLPLIAFAVIAIAATLLLALPPFAGIFLRNDLRADLPHVEILRPWPISGTRLVAAELLAPATRAARLLLTAWVAIVAALLAAAASSGAQWLPAAGSSAGGAAAALTGGAYPAAPLALLVCAFGSMVVAGLPVALLSLAIQNLAALILPGWISLGLERRRGAALSGQRILVLVGHVLAMATALVPAMALVGAVVAVQGMVGGRLSFTFWELPLLAVLAALPVLGETWILVRIGGAYWNRLDPSQEILNPEE